MCKYSLTTLYEILGMKFWYTEIFWLFFSSFDDVHATKDENCEIALMFNDFNYGHDFSSIKKHCQIYQQNLLICQHLSALFYQKGY